MSKLSNQRTRHHSPEVTDMPTFDVQTLTAVVNEVRNEVLATINASQDSLRKEINELRQSVAIRDVNDRETERTTTRLSNVGEEPLSAHPMMAYSNSDGNPYLQPIANSPPPFASRQYRPNGITGDAANHWERQCPNSNNYLKECDLKTRTIRQELGTYQNARVNLCPTEPFVQRRNDIPNIIGICIANTNDSSLHHIHSSPMKTETQRSGAPNRVTSRRRNLITNQLSLNSHDIEIHYIRLPLYQRDGHTFVRLRSGDRIVLPILTRKSIIEESHDNLCHYSITRTKRRVALHYWWPNWSQDVRRYVKTCLTCLNIVSRRKRHFKHNSNDSVITRLMSTSQTIRNTSPRVDNSLTLRPHRLKRDSSPNPQSIDKTCPKPTFVGSTLNTDASPDVNLYSCRWLYSPSFVKQSKAFRRHGLGLNPGE